MITASDEALVRIANRTAYRRTRDRILSALTEQPGMTARELWLHFGMGAASTIRNYLADMVREGLVTKQEREPAHNAASRYWRVQQ